MSGAAEWRPIPVPELQGRYEVSADGQVRRIAAGRGAQPGRIVRRRRCRGSGRLFVELSAGGARRLFQVARLLCWAWHGAPPAGAIALVTDGKPWFLHPAKVRWGSRAELAGR
jgi:hypothetical protein